MRKVVLAVVAMGFGWSSGVGATPIQWTVASGGNGHWYDIVGRGFNGVAGQFLWDEAKVDAESRGGYLATPTSLAEWTFIKSNYTTWLGPTAPGGYESRMGWLGGFQNTGSPSYSEPGGGWEWVTGEPWSFTAWRSGEPNNNGNEIHLVTWFHEGSGWADHHINPFMYYIEYDTNPIPEPSTALLLGIGLVGMAARRRV